MWIVRESFPRQVDKKSRGPQGDRGLQIEENKRMEKTRSLFKKIRDTKGIHFMQRLSQ